MEWSILTAGALMFPTFGYAIIPFFPVLYQPILHLRSWLYRCEPLTTFLIGEEPLARYSRGMAREERAILANSLSPGLNLLSRSAHTWVFSDAAGKHTESTQLLRPGIQGGLGSEIKPVDRFVCDQFCYYKKQSDYADYKLPLLHALLVWGQRMDPPLS